MLHAPKTRASGRAAAMSRAHADVSSRHPLVLGIALGAILSVAITASTASSAAAAVEDHSNAVAALSETAPADSTSRTGALALSVPLADLSAEATTAVQSAQATLEDAQTLIAEVADSDLTLDVESTSIDTSELKAGIAELADIDSTPVLTLALATTDVSETTADVAAATDTLEDALTAAKKKKAAEVAAAKAAAEKKAAQAAANTVEGAKATAKRIAAEQYGWGSDQFSCLVSLWTKESGWNYQAYNSNGGATGIPQALPGSKMATAGSDWRTNATTQIKWGLSYIDRAYGSPCAAWGHSQSVNWY